MTIKLENNAVGYLDQPISAGALALTLQTGQGAEFPALGAGEYFYATISMLNYFEIVKVTARAGDVFTIVRAQENTVALVFPAGSRIEQRITVATITDFTAENPRPASSITNTPAGNVVATNVQAAINELDGDLTATNNALAVLSTQVANLDVPTIADLKNLTVINGLAVLVLGYHTAGDGGGGLFVGAVSGSPGTYTDDAGYTIRPNSDATGATAWLRARTQFVTANQFGARGNETNNAAPAISNAIAYCRANSLQSLYFLRGVYIISQTIPLAGEGIALIGDVGSRQQGTTRPSATLSWGASAEIPSPSAAAMFEFGSNGSWMQFIGFAIENRLNATAFLYAPATRSPQWLIIDNCSFTPAAGTYPFTDAVIYAPASNALGYSVIKNCTIQAVSNYFIRINGSTTPNGVTPILIDNNLIDIGSGPQPEYLSVTQFTLFKLEEEGLDIFTLSNNTINRQAVQLGVVRISGTGGSVTFNGTTTGYTPGYYQVVMTSTTTFNVNYATTATGTYTPTGVSGTTGVACTVNNVTFTVNPTPTNGSVFRVDVGIIRPTVVFDNSSASVAYKVSALNILSNEFDFTYAGAYAPDYYGDRLFKLANVDNVSFEGNQFALGGVPTAVIDLCNSNISSFTGNAFLACGHMFSSLFAFSTNSYKYPSGSSGNFNVGNGTVTDISGGFAPSSASFPYYAHPATREGYYSILLTGASSFNVYDPVRAYIGSGTVGTTFTYVNGAGNTEISFKVNAGTSSWQAGDVIDILAYQSNMSIGNNTSNFGNTYGYTSQLHAETQVVNVPLKARIYNVTVSGGAGTIATERAALPTAPPGYYKVVPTSTTAFDVYYDISSGGSFATLVGSGTSGVQFTTHIKFTATIANPLPPGAFFLFDVREQAYINMALTAPNMPTTYHVDLFRNCGLDVSIFNGPPYGFATRGQHVSVRVSNNSGGALGGVVTLGGMKIASTVWWPVTSAHSVTFNFVADLNKASPPVLNLIELSRSGEVPI